MRDRAAENLARMAADHDHDWPTSGATLMRAASLVEIADAYERSIHALKDVLDVAEREIAGFPIDREEWYARRDFARIQVEDSGV